MTTLLNLHCTGSVAGPMNEAEIAIEKTHSFKSFHETMAFMNALAWICHTEDHHPDVALSYSRCTVRFNTHSVGGISVNDFICAAKVDALVAFVA